MTCRWLRLAPHGTLSAPTPTPPAPYREPWLREYSLIHSDTGDWLGSVLFSSLPLELQTVLETGLAAYFELAHCPVELEAGKERGEDTFWKCELKFPGTDTPGQLMLGHFFQREFLSSSNTALWCWWWQQRLW